MNKNLFHQQAELLISILPYMTKDTDFALHGGTAINFFVRDMPRISVDIDLTYLRLSPREETIKAISDQLKSISKRISSGIPSVLIEEKAKSSKGLVSKLYVKKHNAIVKVEPNNVIRGSLFGPDERAFLISFKEKAPKWELLGVKGAQDMPAVKWKLANLTKMGSDKHAEAVRQLKKIINKED